jgi:hypothetical protein
MYIYGGSSLSDEDFDRIDTVTTVFMSMGWTRGLKGPAFEVWTSQASEGDFRVMVSPGSKSFSVVRWDALTGKPEEMSNNALSDAQERGEAA